MIKKRKQQAVTIRSRKHTLDDKKEETAGGDDKTNKERTLDDKKEETAGGDDKTNKERTLDDKKEETAQQVKKEHMTR